MQYFKNGSTHDKPCKTFTCTKCSKLEITLTFIGASNLIFNNNAQYSSITHFVRVSILIYLMFAFLNFVFFYSITSINFWNLRSHLKLCTKHAYTYKNISFSLEIRDKWLKFTLLIYVVCHTQSTPTMWGACFFKICIVN